MKKLNYVLLMICLLSLSACEKKTIADLSLEEIRELELSNVSFVDMTTDSAGFTVDSKGISENKDFFEDPLQVNIAAGVNAEKYASPSLPEGLTSVHSLSTIHYDEGNVATIQKSKYYRKSVIYIHGGAFLSELLESHMNFADGLVSIADAKVYIPIYKPISAGTYKEAYALIETLYNDISQEKTDIYIIGDSAGASVALGFSEYAIEKGLQKPKQIYLISPWLDLSLSNEKIPEYEAKDKILASEGLRIAGKIWADDLDIKDPKVSPIFGDIDKLPEIILTVGTEELFYPDTVEFFDKLNMNGNKVKLIIGDGLFHNFPLYSFLDCTIARIAIYNILNEDW